MKTVKKPTNIIGIDEAGRGPLAGPVYVAAVQAPARFDFSIFTGLTDSKVLSESVREKLFLQLQQSDLRFAVCHSTAKTIDKIGINPGIQQSINRSLRKLVEKGQESETQILLDGGLAAPRRFSCQKTIVKGDAKEPAISLASIAAKVMRDRKITRMSGQYPHFDFAQHKGYGTARHRARIKEHGPTAIHRKTFLKNILNERG